MLNNIDKMKELLLYQEIESAEGDTLKLKNGTAIELYEEDYDWCAGADGRWIATKNFQGAITDVKFEYNVDVDDHYLTVTIFNNQNKIAQANAFADCGGSGYYYSVLSVRVRDIHHDIVDDFRLLDTF